MMCAGAVAFAGIKRVVYAAPDPQRGAVCLFNQLDFYRSQNVVFERGPLRDESKALLSRYSST